MTAYEIVVTMATVYVIMAQCVRFYTISNIINVRACFAVSNTFQIQMFVVNMKCEREMEMGQDSCSGLGSASSLSSSAVLNQSIMYFI